jgi:hypothetical protein
MVNRGDARSLQIGSASSYNHLQLHRTFLLEHEENEIIQQINITSSGANWPYTDLCSKESALSSSTQSYLQVLRTCIRKIQCQARRM